MNSWSRDREVEKVKATPSLAFVAGKFKACSQCHSTNLPTVGAETFDEQADVWVGNQICRDCGESYIYSRRAETPEEEVFMAKRSKKKTNGKAPKRAARKHAPAAHHAAAHERHEAVHRVTTHKPNGGISESAEVAPPTKTVGEAMRLAVKELGPVVIDEGAAVGQMRQLADYYDRVAEERAAYNAKADAARIAKKSLESAVELLLERVKAFTHGPSLPLFDAAEREQNLEDMVDRQAEEVTDGAGIL